MLILAVIAVVAGCLIAANRVHRTEVNPNEIRVLAVSDLHNNLDAMGLVERLARKCKVDLILDTGDITDFGTTSENGIVERARGVPVPHIFVAGNHDSTDTIAAMRENKNSYLPDEKVVEVAGLSILGQDDPASRSKAPHSVDSKPGDIELSLRRLRNVLNGLPKRPDVLLVHQPRIAEPFTGKAPLIVDGHVHTMYVRHEGGSIIVNPGSTGAAGIRYVTQGRVDKMTAAVIYIRRLPRFAVTRVDLISVGTKSGKETAETIENDK
jgi:predicted phosphodiesterase